MSRVRSLIFAAFCVILPVAHGLYLRPNPSAQPSLVSVDLSDDHLLIQQHVEKMQKDNPIKHIKDALDKAGKTGSRPLMNTINVMRAEFCLRRPDLLSHEKCLKFLLEKCMVQTSGYGYCSEFHEILEKECDKGEVLPGEHEACDYHNQLDPVVEPDEEEPTPEPTTTVAPTTAAPTTAAPTTAAPTEAPEAQEIAEEAPAIEVDDGDAESDDAGAAASPAPASPLAPGPAGAPGPGPAPLPPAHSEVTNFDKKWRDLPEQGYDEHSDPKWVQHQDFDTQTEDWRQEWPSWDETEGQSTDRICEERPDHLWCKLWLKDRARGPGGPPPSSSAQRSGSHAERKGGRVSTKEQIVEQKEESQENVEDGVAATGDQFGDAADQTSEVLPPGMSPTEKDLKDGRKTKAKTMSDSGHDLPPGMLTHPDDYESNVAFKSEVMRSASPEIHFGDDDDFASDDVNYDDPEAVDASLNDELNADGDATILTEKSM